MDFATSKPHSELLIRPSISDLKAIEDLLIPAEIGTRPISRLVVNAPDAIERRQTSFGKLAAASGTPILIDPGTMLVQQPVNPDSRWARDVPYIRSNSPVPREQLTNDFYLERLTAEVIEFQFEHGASAIVPPYFHARDADSPEFAASIAALAKTARRMRAEGLALPIVPVLSFQLTSFLRRQDWQVQFDRYLAAASGIGPQAIALEMSPLGDGKEGFAKLHNLFLAARYIKGAGNTTVAWRQGIYGPALVALGLDGYECGMGIGEATNASRFIANQKPHERSGRPYRPAGFYLQPLGRSVPRKVARTLLEDRALRGYLVCDSRRCCPEGAESMLSSHGRPHAVRSRARDLRELDSMPREDWRLHHVGKSAAAAIVTAKKANEVLERNGLPNRIKTEGYAALSEMAARFRHASDNRFRHSA